MDRNSGTNVESYCYGLSRQRRRCSPPPSLLTVHLRRGCAAVLLAQNLGDLRVAVELLREELAAARANPDMGPAHARRHGDVRLREVLAHFEAQL
jgi:hypothetical protein